jgi:tRNA-uridine 2-sulfurtransferase
VLVAMSGGVDSSVAAMLLKQQGLHVEGVTFDLGLDREGPRHAALSCSLAAAAERARQVCLRLDIPHQVVECAKTFRDMVIDPFCSQYDAGRTPNPCVRCNAFVKWPSLFGVASTIGCSHVATGHYARIQQSGDRFQILRGQDRGKDQSYALYALAQESLRRTLLPLGPMTKADVRRIAGKASLPTSDTRESQDICFIPEGDYRSFLARRLSVHPGPIQDRDGNALGLHRGLPFYTVGQRKGLGIPAGKALYVIEKNAACNLLVVGTRADLHRETFCAAEVNWVSTPSPPEGSTLQVDVEVRYRSRPIPAELQVLDFDAVRIRLAGSHDQAIAPGQSAVWYRADLLLGGGIIQESGIGVQGSGPS